MGCWLLMHFLHTIFQHLVHHQISSALNYFRQQNQQMIIFTNPLFSWMKYFSKFQFIQHSYRFSFLCECIRQVVFRSYKKYEIDFTTITIDFDAKQIIFKKFSCKNCLISHIVEQRQAICDISRWIDLDIMSTISFLIRIATSKEFSNTVSLL